VAGSRLGLAPGGEFDLIRSFFPDTASAARADIPVGVGDDCAVVAGAGIAISCDMSVEGVHFRRDWLDDREVGFRAAASALSDLAAVAARPIGLLAALALPEHGAQECARALMRGITEAAATVGAAVLGGDVTRTEGPLVIDITVVGEAGEPVLRSGAAAGDEFWVTGLLGGAAVAVSQLLGEESVDPEARVRFAAPEPRTREAVWLRERGVLRSLVDLSDGLAGDAAHIAAASGVAIVLDADAVPIHPAALRATSADHALRLALGGGEDYELCFSAAPGAVAVVAEAFAREFGVPLTRVGRVEAGEGVHLEGRGVARQPLAFGGFQHFTGEHG